MPINQFRDCIVITDTSGEKFALMRTLINGYKRILINGEKIQTLTGQYTSAELIKQAKNSGRQFNSNYATYNGKLVNIRKILREADIYFDDEEYISTDNAEVKRVIDDYVYFDNAPVNSKYLIPENQWSFSSRRSSIESKDLGYSVTYKDCTEDISENEIIDSLRSRGFYFSTNCSIVLEDGIIVIDKNYYSPGYIHEAFHQHSGSKLDGKEMGIGSIDVIREKNPDTIVGEISDEDENIQFFANGNVVRKNRGHTIDKIILDVNVCEKFVEILCNGEIERINFVDIKFVRKLHDLSIIFALFSGTFITRVFRAQSMRFDESANLAVWEKLNGHINKI